MKLISQSLRGNNNMTVSTFLTLLSAFSVISGLVTEGIKKIVNDKANISYNITALIVAVVVGIIVGDVKGAIGVLLFPIVLGLLGFLAKCLIAGWFLFAIFAYAMYIAMDFTAAYMIVYAIRHRKKAK